MATESAASLHSCSQLTAGMVITKHDTYPAIVLQENGIQDIGRLAIRTLPISHVPKSHCTSFEKDIEFSPILPQTAHLSTPPSCVAYLPEESPFNPSPAALSFPSPTGTTHRSHPPSFSTKPTTSATSFAHGTVTKTKTLTSCTRKRV